MQAHTAGILIVGAGQAGPTAAAALRQYGYTGRIRMVGDEPHLPYQRPPLSKEWLRGAMPMDRLLLRRPSFYATQRIEVRTGERVARIERAAKTVHLASGEVLAYDALILALGSTPALPRLPNADHEDVLVLRSLADSDRLRAAFAPGRRLNIIGGGYVGLEVAASARAGGLAVTLIERADRVLSRVASGAMSNWFEDLHRAQGVRILTGSDVSAIEAREGRLRGVRLASGELVDGDLVLLAVGAAPCDALAADAGIACAGGIMVDGECRSSDPCIYAIGDCAVATRQGRPLRLESVANANEQARRAAASLCGRPLPPEDVPWFWSDQYDAKLQMAGLCADASTHVLRGSMQQARFSIFHLRADRSVAAVESVNDPAGYMAGKSWIAHRSPPEPGVLAAEVRQAGELTPT